MPCCGQNREQARTTAPIKAQQQVQTSQPVPSALQRPASAPAPSGPMTRVHYTGVAEISVRGPQSGRAYVFSGKNPDRLIPRGDVEGLLRVGLFRRI